MLAKIVMMPSEAICMEGKMFGSQLGILVFCFTSICNHDNVCYCIGKRKVIGYFSLDVMDYSLLITKDHLKRDVISSLNINIDCVCLSCTFTF